MRFLSTQYFPLRRLVEQLSTAGEIEYFIACNSSKYSLASIGLRTIEGGEELLLREKYCPLMEKAAQLAKYAHATAGITGTLILALEGYRNLSRV